MSLKEKIAQLPPSAGVYLMKDQKGVIIYVGKAKNLKNRVSSYFRGTAPSYKTRALVEDIRDFDLIVAKNEVEALLLERNLIKHHQPRYNILLRDDKEYPYIRANFNDPWPRIHKVRKRKDDGATYIGPFGNTGLLNTLLKTILRIFPLIRCSHHEFKNAKRPCNYYHMKMCLGPCTLPVDRQEYVDMIKNALAVLEGKNSEVKQLLEQKMQTAAENELFEKAASYRDQIYALDHIADRQIAVLQNIENADAVGFHEDEQTITFNIALVRGYHIIGNESFIVGAGIEEMQDALVSFILQYYEKRHPPKEIILPLTIPNRKELSHILAQDHQLLPEFITGKKDEYKDLIDLAKKNAKLYHDQMKNLNLRHKAELEMLQKTLRLDQIPKRIECIDISNTQETAIVASCVCFIDGKPAKDYYRRYNIKNLDDKPNDFASIHEVVSRRIERGIKEDDLPDLLIIDGGRGQLNAALDAASRFPQVKLPIVSLAKSRLSESLPNRSDLIHRSQERIFLPDQDLPIFLEEGIATTRLVTRIRDEAHRFAITFHRKKRQKVSHSSSLDEIPGVGPILKRRLIETFGGWDGLKQASLDQISEIPGVHEKLALLIFSSIHIEET